MLATNSIFAMNCNCLNDSSKDALCYKENFVQFNWQLRAWHGAALHWPLEIIVLVSCKHQCSITLSKYPSSWPCQVLTLDHWAVLIGHNLLSLTEDMIQNRDHHTFHNLVQTTGILCLLSRMWVVMTHDTRCD